jgi:hypothetical protein
MSQPAISGQVADEGRGAADRRQHSEVAGFASEIKRALNQGLIESVTYDRGAIFFDAHLGPE